MYYFPTCPPETRGQAFIEVNEGRPFDVDTIPPPCPPPPRRQTSAAGRVTLSPNVDDQSLLQIACRAANGDKFSRLYAGDTSGYSSLSEADLALIGMLAFYAGPDPDRLERLFDQSGLAHRSKWQRADYRAATIRRALAGRSVFYRPRNPRAPQSFDELLSRSRTFTGEERDQWLRP